MNMQEIRNIAKNYDIKTAKMSKLELVKKIQLAEGHFDCFATPLMGECDQTGCMWRDDCFTLAKKQSAAN